MRSGRLGAARGDVLRLFDGGSVAGLGDGELLGRFADRRDEAAFEGLVARLGPMVLGVCRRMLADPHDVDDAFQATFLVLVRRAGSIRDRDLVGPWLHGVAARVARRARAESSRRKARERVAVVPEAVEAVAEVEPGWPELRALIDEEIDRLPEHHRRAVVLCDVEGLSREEAAIRLGWTPNMVRGRLERARGRLRGRLARRGLAPPGAWSALVASTPVPPPAPLASSTIRAALASPGGQVGAGLATAPAVALSRGVLRMMMLAKMKIGLAVLCSAGFVAAGSGMLAAQGPGGGVNPTPSKPVAEAPAPQRAAPGPGDSDPFKPRPIADLARARIERAKQRLKARKVLYDEGRVTADRVIDPSRALMDAERDAAGTKAARVEAVRAHHARVLEVLKREKADLEVGHATTADIAEPEQELLDTEFLLAKELEAPEAKPAGGEAGATRGAEPREAAPTTALEPFQPRSSPRRGVAPAAAAPPFQPRSPAELAERRVKAASQRFEAQKAFYDEGRITVDRLIDASRTLMEAERDASGTKAGRVDAVRAHHARLGDILKRERGELEVGWATIADVAEIESDFTDAESALAREMEAPEAKPAGFDAKAGSRPAADPRPVEPTALAKLAKDRVERDRKRFETQVLFYREKRIAVAQLLEASQRLMDTEIDAADTSDARPAAIRAHLARIEEIEKHERAELAIGRSSTADIMEIENRHLDTEFRLARESARRGPGTDEMERRLTEVERKLDRLLNLIDAPRLEKR